MITRPYPLNIYIIISAYLRRVINHLSEAASNENGIARTADDT
jgi:hypothetical protein